MPEAIGKPLDRVDGRLKVTGSAPYAADWVLPNLVHAALIQSSVGAGRITRVDDSQARAQKGVLHVITFQNVPKPGLPKVASPDEGAGPAKQPMFGGPEVSYNGQHIGVVIADTLERAGHAAGLVRFEYAEQKPRVEMEKFEGEAIGLPKSPSLKRGDLAAGRARAAQSIEATYDIPPEHHNPIEPHATIATWNRDHLTVYHATQGVQSNRESLAEAFGLPVENVRVICPFLGGGFGCKGTAGTHLVICAMAARVAGRPVKLVMRRQEMFTGHGHRAHTKQVLELGASGDGALSMMRHHTLNETSMLDDWEEDTSKMTKMMYACENVETSNKVVRLHKMSPTYMRAPGEGAGGAALECAMDEMAEKLGLDPVEFRLKNDTLTDGATKHPFSSRAYKECLAQGRELFGWKERRTTPATWREGNWLIGYGVAGATYPASYWPSSARMTLSRNGQVLIQSSSHDLGTGAYTIFTQIGADALGVPVEQVRVELGDTRLAKGTLAAGSTTSASTGAAILDAASKLKAQLIASLVASKNNPLSGLSAQQVRAENGRIFSIQEPTRSVSYTDALRATGQLRAEALGDTGKARREDRSYYSFGAHFTRVRVDVELGQVRVERMLGIYGAGRILNAKTARSQMLGGMVWGIGMALHEHTDYDPNNGRVVTRNLADYHIPSCADTPEFEVIFVPETDTDISPVGAKGIGELGIVGVAASVANAIYNATGKRIREFPITPDKLI